jgi:hypothetical protein
MVIKFPENWTDIKRAITKGNKPVLNIRPAPLGKPMPTGKSLIIKHGETPEEALAKIAPAEAKSKPERMLYGWLIKHNISFAYQTSVAGGRAVPGGAVLDFVIYEKATPIVIRIQSYWHLGAENVLGDDIQLNMLQQMGFVVEDVQEYEITTAAKIDEVMRRILYGTPKWRDIG